MKDICSMSYSELYREFKLILNLKYLNNIITDPEVLKEFYSQFKGIRESGLEEKDYMRIFFERHSKSIDKEAYVFYTLKTIQEGNVGKFEEISKKCKEALKDSKFMHFEPYKFSKWNGDEIRCVTAQDLIGMQRKPNENEKMNRVKKLAEKIDFQSLFSINSTSEMNTIYGKNLDLNAYITKLGMIDALNEIAQLPIKEKIKILDDSNTQRLSELIEQYRGKIEDSTMEKFFLRIPEYVQKYPEQFDLDKILIIAAYRINYYLEKSKLTIEDNKEFAKALKIIRDNIDSRSVSVTGLTANDGSNQGKEKYSYKALVEACKRITEDGIYVSSVEEMIIRDDLESDPSVILEINPEIFKIIKFTTRDYIDMVDKKPGILGYLVENNLITNSELDRFLKRSNIAEEDFIDLMNKDLLTKTQMEAYIKKEGHVTENVFRILEEKKIFNVNEKLNYYINGIIELELLNSVPEKEKKEIAELLSPEELINLYKNPSKQAEYMRYASLFRTMVLTEKSKEEKIDIAEQMIENLGMDVDEENLIKLYQEHLIPLKTLENWTGSYVITQMMRNAMLKPIDVKEICSDGNYECLFEIMKDAGIKRKNKLAILYTTFSGDGDGLTEEQINLKEEAKKKCLKYLDLSDKNTRTSQSTSMVRISRGNGESEKRNEYISDPFARWNLIELLDREFSYEILDQGMMIFRCPHLNNGTIILEKMFRKDEPDYARATKVLNISIEDFEKIKNDLIINGDIPVAAVDSHPALNGITQSIWHGAAWGQRMADLFGYSTDLRREPENIQRIDETIERIKNSRKLRD